MKPEFPRVRADNVCKIYQSCRGPLNFFKELMFSERAGSGLEALSNVSFEAHSGEAFGIIGDNGAGKSTLLKILSGTAFPSSGGVHVIGRIAALLELGIGFHPDFSGRDNILFSGALQGLERAEIRRREPEIIEFSELADAIDQPVRTYSTGMLLRLGFAVATGFDPDVVIIDEALAVGDQHFVKKSTERILEFKESGRTIILCSHNLYQVRSLCERSLWLERGRVVEIGESAAVVDRYVDSTRQSANGSASGVSPESAKIREFSILDSSARVCDTFQSGDSVLIRLVIHITDTVAAEPLLQINLMRNDGLKVGSFLFRLDPALGRGEREHHLRLELPALNLLSGKFLFEAALLDQYSGKKVVGLQTAASFCVRYGGQDFGLLRLPFHWSSAGESK